MALSQYRLFPAPFLSTDVLRPGKCRTSGRNGDWLRGANTTGCVPRSAPKHARGSRRWCQMPRLVQAWYGSIRSSMMGPLPLACEARPPVSSCQPVRRLRGPTDFQLSRLTSRQRGLLWPPFHLPPRRPGWFPAVAGPGYKRCDRSCREHTVQNPVPFLPNEMIRKSKVRSTYLSVPL